MFDQKKVTSELLIGPDDGWHLRTRSPISLDMAEVVAQIAKF